MVGLETIASVGGAVLGGLGGVFGGGDSPPTPFQTLPGEVQSGFLDVLLPGAIELAEQPFQGVPLRRVEAPSTIFDSPELFALQQAFDAQNQPISQAPTTPAGALGALANPAVFNALITAQNPNFGIASPGVPTGFPIGRPSTSLFPAFQVRQEQALDNAFQDFLNNSQADQGIGLPSFPGGF